MSRQRESVVLAEIRLALGREPGLTLWRNAVATGDFWDEKRGGSAFVQAGLPKGSADLIGILTMQVHIGIQPFELGRFFALEVKRLGERPQPHQEEWLALVRRRGGFGGWADSVEAARAALERARKGACM